MKKKPKKTDCPVCNGDGTIPVKNPFPPNDIVHTPCGRCNGRGWIYKTKRRTKECQV